MPDAPSVFISYRRDDASGSAGRLHGDLKRHFGAQRVFRDRDMRAGINWVRRLRALADACHVMLVVIGPRWSTVTREAQPTPRLFEPGDALRGELETALARDEVTIIPVLVDGAAMPERNALPDSLAELSEIHAFTLFDELWDDQLRRLTAELEATLGLGGTTEMPSSPALGAAAEPSEPEPVPDWEPGREVGPAAWWPALALAGTAAAVLLAAPVSGAFERKPTAGSAFSLPLDLARERIAYYALERAVFWGLVGLCALVTLSLAVRSERGAAASGIAGLAAGATGGLLGGVVFQGGKFLANPDVAVLSDKPAEWLLQVPNVAVPAAFVGWAIAGAGRRLGRLEGAMAAVACGMVAVALKGPIDARFAALVIEGTLVTAPVLLAAASSKPRRAIVRG